MTTRLVCLDKCWPPVHAVFRRALPAVLALFGALLMVMLTAQRATAQDETDPGSLCRSAPLFAAAGTRAVSNEPSMDYLGVRTVFWSTLDIAGDTLQNADGSIEIFGAERTSTIDDLIQTFDLGQLTQSPGNILGGFNIMPDVVTSLDQRTYVFFASNGDLETENRAVVNNQDGGFEIFLAQMPAVGDPVATPRVWQLTDLKSSAALLPVVSQISSSGTRHYARLAFVADADSGEDLNPWDNTAQGANPTPPVAGNDGIERNFEVFVVTVSFGTPGSRPILVGSYAQLTASTGEMLIDQPAISSDGRSVAFVANANTVGDLNSVTATSMGNSEIYFSRLNPFDPSTTSQNITRSGVLAVTSTPASVENRNPDVSQLIDVDGAANNQNAAARVVFVSTATTFAGATRTSTNPEVFAATVNQAVTGLYPAGQYIRVSAAVQAPPGRAITARDPVLDAAGRRVVFVSDGCDGGSCLGNDAPPDGRFQLFIGDLNTGNSGFSISRATNPAIVGGEPVFRIFEAPVMSGDGQYLAAVASAGDERVDPDLSGSEVLSLYCPRANIAVSKQFVKAGAAPGDTLINVGDTVVYSVTVSNNSISTFTGTVTITDTLPLAHLTWVDAAIVAPPPGTDVKFLPGNQVPNVPSPGNPTLKWEVDHLDPRTAATVLITLTVKATAAGATVVNAVNLDSPDAEALVDQGLLVLTDQASATFSVTQVDLSSQLSVSPVVEREGQPLIYTLTLRNNVVPTATTQYTATGVVLEHTPIVMANFVSVTPVLTTGTWNAGTSEWLVPAIGPGQTLRLQLRAVAKTSVDGFNGSGGAAPISLALTSLDSEQQEIKPANNLPAAPVLARIRGTDLAAISVSASITRPNPGEFVTLYYKVVNRGPNPGAGALTDAPYTGNASSFVPNLMRVVTTLPAGVTFVSGSQQVIEGGAASVTLGAGNVLTATFAPGANPTTAPITRTFAISVQVNFSTPPGTVMNVPLNRLRGIYAPSEGAGIFPDPNQANNADGARSVTLTVNTPSTVGDIFPEAITEGQAVTLTVTYTDPDLDDRHFIHVAWGDGSTHGPTSELVRTPPGNQVGNYTTTHVYADNPPGGTVYTATVTITDTRGGVKQTQVPVTVNNQLPGLQAATIFNHNFKVGETFVVSTTQKLSVTVAFTDPGFTPIFPGAFTAETFEYYVEWGDGTTTTNIPEAVRPPSATGPSTGTVKTAHTYSAVQVAPVTAYVRVRDDDTGFWLTPPFHQFSVFVNNPPVAVDDSLTVTENQTTTSNLLANDLDPSDSVSLAGLASLPTTGTVTYTDAAGNVTFSAETNFDYLSQGELASDSFTYTVTDSVGWTDIGRVHVTITGVNDAPVTDLNENSAAFTTTVAFVEDAGSAKIAPSARFTDVDSNLVAVALILNTAPDGASEFLTTTTSVAGITTVWDPLTRRLDLTSAAPLPPASYTTVLRGVVYSNTSEISDTTARVVFVRAQDVEGAFSNIPYSIITMQQVDDKPVIIPALPNATVVESSPAALIDAGIVITDIDTGNFSGGLYTVTVVSSDTPRDRLTLLNGNGVSLGGNTVFVDGFVVATVTGNFSDRLVFALQANALQERVQRMAQQVAYARLPGRPPASVTINFTIRTAPDSVGNASVTRSITAVNDAPSITVTLPPLSEDTTVPIQSSYTLADPEVIGQNVIFTVTVQNGTLALTGLTDESPIADTVRIVTTLAALNNQSGYTLAYTPNQDYFGGENFTFSLDDQQVEPAGIPYCCITQQVRNVSVAPVNDAPLLDLNSANGASFDNSAAFSENGPAVTVAATALITDVDSTQMISATAAISMPMGGGVETLSFTTSGGIVGNFSAATGVLRLTGTASTADYITTLRSIQYNNASEAPLATRVVEFVVRDASGADSAERKSTINVTTFDDPPTVIITDTLLVLNEDDSAARVDAGANLIDPDTVHYNSGTLTVTVSAPSNDTDDRLNVQTSGDSPFSFSSSNVRYGQSNIVIGTVTGRDSRRMVFTFDSDATVDRVRELLRWVTYNRRNTGEPTIRSIIFELRDAAIPAVGIDSRPLQVFGINTAPVVTVADLIEAVEDQTTGIASAITVSDVDAGSGALKLTASLSGNGVLRYNTVTPPSGVTLVSGDGTPTLILTGTLPSLTSMLAAANNIVFSPTTNYSGTVTLNVSVDDQGHTPPPAKVGSDTGTIRVKGVNDAPVVTLTPTSTAEDTLVNIATNIGLADVDALNGTLRLTVTVGSGTLGRTLTGGVTEASSSATQLVVTGNLSSLTAWLATASNLRFTPAGDTSGVVNLTVVLNDQGASSWPPPQPLIDTEQTTITVSAVNDAPTVSVTPFFINEDSPSPITGKITIADVDAAASTMKLTVTVTSGQATVLFSPCCGVTFLGANGTNQLRFEGTLGALQTMLAGSNMTVGPTASFSGTTQLSAVISDQIASPVSANGPLQVRGINDAPTLGFAASSVTAVEDTAVSLHNLILINDIDALAFTTRLTVTIGAGTLTVSPGAGVTVNNVSAQQKALTGKLGDLQTTLGTVNGLVFTPALNVDTPTTLSATYSDLGASAFLASAPLLASGSIPANITAVNDEPTITGLNVMTVTTTTVSSPITIPVPVSALNTSDPDNTGNQIIYTVQTLPALGSLRLNNVPLTACPGPGNTFTQADVNAASVRYSHNSSVVATPTLVYRVANSVACGSGGTQGTLQIRIRAP